jgi:hypothetical protein
LKQFAAEYLQCLRAYLREPCESTLRAAYELGREAVQRELSVLELAIAHHDALAVALGDKLAASDDPRFVRAGGDFFLESVSAFEMVQRGFREARDAALLERRHSGLLRQLSHFLADASLALDASNSLDEMLRLVAEQTRELIPAECCLVAVGDEDSARVRAASYPEEDLRWVALVRWIDLTQVGAVVRSTGRPTRIAADEIATHVRVPGGGSAADLVLRGWLGTPLTALDGRAIGSVHLVNKNEGDFTELDEAVLEHLAQMSAAAIERARLYSGGPSNRAPT